MQKLHTYCWEKIFSAYVIGVVITFYISFSEVLSGFLFGVIWYVEEESVFRTVQSGFL